MHNEEEEGVREKTRKDMGRCGDVHLMSCGQAELQRAEHDEVTRVIWWGHNQYERHIWVSMVVLMIFHVLVPRLHPQSVRIETHAQMGHSHLPSRSRSR